MVEVIRTCRVPIREPPPWFERMSAAPEFSSLIAQTTRDSMLAESALSLRRYPGSRSGIFLNAELAWFAVSAAVVPGAEFRAHDLSNWRLAFGQAGTLAFVYLLAFYLMDLYDLDILTPRRPLLMKLMQATALAGVTVSLLAHVVWWMNLRFGLIVLHACSTAIYILALRGAIERLAGTRWPLPTIGFLGTRGAYADLEKEKPLLNWLGFRLEMLSDSLRQARQELRADGKNGLGARHSLGLSQGPADIHRLLFDESCLGQPGASGFLQECEREGIKVEKLSSFRERTFGKLDLGPCLVDELALGENQAMARLNAAMRRVRDILIAGSALLLALPLMLIIAAAIKCDSHGPVFFLQERVGKNGRRFKMIKFRSMYHAQDEAEQGLHCPTWATSRRDPRITRIGAIIRGFHADELPQLINVLNGDMSLVGPRPFHPLHCAHLEKIAYSNLRNLVLPGITGWAQVRCDYSDSMDHSEEVLARDLYYVKHAGIAFDLMIIVETLRICLWRRGAR
jgi:exopolysaccharide biosynthesis polyprenyl glycosylphosphotransferase